MGSRFVTLSLPVVCLVSILSVSAWESIEIPQDAFNVELLKDQTTRHLIEDGLPLRDPIAVEKNLSVLAFKEDPLNNDDRTLLKIVLSNLRQWRKDKATLSAVHDSLTRVHSWLRLQKCLNDAEDLGLVVFKRKVMSEGWANADQHKYQTVEDFVERMTEIHWVKRSERWVFMFENANDTTLADIKPFALEAISQFNTPKNAAYEIQVFEMELDHRIQKYASCPSAIVSENVRRIENEVLANLLYTKLTANILEARYLGISPVV